jgi:hypothetical protein
VLLLGALLTGGSGPASAAVAPLGCESVFFLGAVGSGEWPGTNQDQQLSTYFGLRVRSVLKYLRRDLNGTGRGIAAYSLMYPAVTRPPQL